MKEVIVVMDQDPTYSKKFCNQAIKLYGKKYIFLSFQSAKRLKEYAKENKIESIIISDEIKEFVEDINANKIYILNEKYNKTKKEGKKIYVYKFQNIKSILSIVEEDIDKKCKNEVTSGLKDTKIVLFFSPVFIKNKMEILKKMSKIMSKNAKTLIVDIDEFTNYKGAVGLSNIIYNYKENNLDLERIRKEIVCEKDQDYIKSVTYPDDFSVINNIDLANIINEVKNLDYNYIFVNADSSFIKCQYIANDSDIIILINDKNNATIDSFKNYVTIENQIDYKKIFELDSTKADKAYLSAFVGENIDIDE